MKKRIFSIFLALVTVLCMIPVTVATVSAEDAVTVEDWSAAEIHLKTEDDYLAFLNKLGVQDAFKGQTVYLDNDLYFEGREVALVHGVASSTLKGYKKGFTGTFDGQNHIIKGLTVGPDTTEGDLRNTNFGMFGSVFDQNDGAAIVIRNTAFVDCKVYGSNLIGGLYGYTICKGGATFENLYVDIDVVATSGDTAGGIIAEAGDWYPNVITFNNVVYAGTVTAGKNAGGFIAYGWWTTEPGGNDIITFNNCVYNGTIQADLSDRVVGGFVGTADIPRASDDVTTITFKNCLSVGAFEGAATAGGFIGKNRATVKVENSISACGLGNDAWEISKIKDDSPDVVVDEFSAINPGSMVGMEANTYLTAAGMTGYVVSATGAPMPKALLDAGLIPTVDADKVTVTDWTASTIHLRTKKDYIAFLDHLITKPSFLNQTVCLENDLDFDGEEYQIQGKASGWGGYGFYGTFDGQNHMIKGLNVKANSERVNTFGMFGGITLVADAMTPTIKNTAFVECSVTGNNRVGGLYGYVEGSAHPVFENLYIDIDVTGQDTVAGVIATGCDDDPQHPTTATFKNVVYAGTVTGIKQVGGFFGYGWGKSAFVMDFTNCVFCGTVKNNTSSDVAGGFVATSLGIADTSSISFKNCLSVGEVIGGAVQSGFVADLRNIPMTVENCISACGMENDAWAQWNAEGKVTVDQVSTINPGSMIGMAANDLLTAAGVTGFVASATGVPMPKALADAGLIPSGEAASVVTVKGYQSTAADTTTGKFSIRLVGAVAKDTVLDDYFEVGFALTALYNDGTEDKSIAVTKSTNVVYDKIGAASDAVEYTAADLNAEALYVMVCANVPADAHLEVTPFAKDTNGKTIWGSTVIFTPVAAQTTATK